MARSDALVYQLASNLSATGAAVAIRGGNYMFMVNGTVTGATISLQMQMPDASWCDVAVFSGSVVKSTTLPFNQTGVDLPAGNVRMAATGGTPTGLNAWLAGIG